MRRATTAAAAIALGLLPAACSTSSGSDSPSLTPNDVQRYVAVKEASDDLSYLIELIGTGDSTVREFAQSPTGSAAADRFLSGAKLSWNNVLVGLNEFRPQQAVVVPELANFVQTQREVAINWGNALNGLGSHPHLSQIALAKRFAPVVKQEQQARKPLNQTAATLAKLACSLERTNTSLNSVSATRADCANALALARLATG
jgi:hypothetical protein